MGLSFVYFVVLAPSAYQMTVEPYDPVYVTQSLLPARLLDPPGCTGIRREGSNGEREGANRMDSRMCTSEEATN
jgi:hypothetical protein